MAELPDNIVINVTVEGVDEVREKLNHLIKEVKQIMADLSGLQAAVANIQTVDGEAASELQALAAQVANLTAGTVSQAQLDELAAQLNTTATAVASAVTSAEGTPPTPAPTPEPAPQPPAEEETPPPPPAEPGGLHVEEV